MKVVFIISENITLLYVTFRKISIICYTWLFFWDPQYTYVILFICCLFFLLVASYPSELPPPTYEVAAGGLQEIPSKSGHDYTFGKLLYAPRYPFYNFDAETDLSPGSTTQYPEKIEFPFFPTDESSSSLHGPPPPRSHKRRSPRNRRAANQRMADSPSPNLDPPVDQPLLHPLSDEALASPPEVEVSPPNQEPLSNLTISESPNHQPVHNKETGYSPVASQEPIDQMSPDDEAPSQGLGSYPPVQEEPPDQYIPHDPPDADPVSGQDINVIMQNSVSAEKLPTDGTQNDAEDVPTSGMEHDPPTGGAEAPSTTV